MVIITFGQPEYPRLCVLLLLYSQGCCKVKTGTEQYISYPPWSSDKTDNVLFCFSFAIISSSFLLQATSSQKQAVSFACTFPHINYAFFHLFALYLMTVLEASCVLRECYMSRESGYEITPRVIFFSPPVIMENNIFAWWVHCLPGNLYVCAGRAFWLVGHHLGWFPTILCYPRSCFKPVVLNTLTLSYHKCPIFP